MRSEATWDLLIGVPFALALAGCNMISGIHPAHDGVWDGSTATGENNVGNNGGDSSVQPSGSSGGGSGGGAPIDAQAFQSDASAVWANWPMPNPASYDASSPDFVYDAVTRLTWQSTLDLVVLSDGGTEAISLPWSDAVAYCSKLSLDDGGWRLPARIELISLLNVTANPAIDPTSFPNTPPEEFWTATAFAPGPTSAWYVNFGFSVELVAFDDKTAPHHVRCVR